MKFILNTSFVLLLCASRCLASSIPGTNLQIHFFATQDTTVIDRALLNPKCLVGELKNGETLIACDQYRAPLQLASLWTAYIALKNLDNFYVLGGLALLGITVSVNQQQVEHFSPVIPQWYQNIERKRLMAEQLFIFEAIRYILPPDGQKIVIPWLLKTDPKNKEEPKKSQSSSSSAQAAAASPPPPTDPKEPKGKKEKMVKLSDFVHRRLVLRDVLRKKLAESILSNNELKGFFRELEEIRAIDLNTNGELDPVKLDQANVRLNQLETKISDLSEAKELKTLRTKNLEALAKKNIPKDLSEKMRLAIRSSNDIPELERIRVDLSKTPNKLEYLKTNLLDQIEQRGTFSTKPELKARLIARINRADFDQLRFIKRILNTHPEDGPRTSVPLEKRLGL